MIPYETDPSLHDHEPMPAQLDDGFSPPQPAGSGPAAGERQQQQQSDAPLRDSQHRS